jgi:serine/threonine protein kinase
MTPDRWEKINRIYDTALEVGEAERAAFVREACQGDEELRGEVESLLAYDQQAQQLIDRSALELTAERLAAEPPSAVGRKLGPYQILGALGAGGMGEVYRARDTRLNRTVAIKVLPRHLSERADLRQRFEREARAIASLDHPHICALYDIGHEGNTVFLVMQYLKGETLSQRLKRGVLTTQEALRYSIEVAGALQTAHRKGVIHRDLKPGNIMLTEAGAKLLDFGLAKRQPVLSPLAQASSGFSGGQAATESKSLTEAGMILGTLEYMAPEQLEGKEADARTDIFALGVVIYEMATGRKAFEGDSKASLIAKILTFQPPSIKAIQPVSPLELDRVVQKCLAKKPEERWQSATELISELQEIAATVLPRIKAGERESGETKEVESEAKAAVSVVVPQPPKALSRLIHSRGSKLTLVGILLAVITGSVGLWRARKQPDKTAAPKELSLKALTKYASDNVLESSAISPDGKYLAFCSKGKLFVQDRTGYRSALDLPEGFHPGGASWFPDGTKLLIDRAEEERGQFHYSVWSMSILGGKPQPIVDNATFSTVSPDGLLVAFSRDDPARKTSDIWLVGSNGESPRRIRASSQPDPNYFRPVWSSSGKRLFFRRHDDRDKSEAIESCDLAGGKVTTIFSTKQQIRWDLCWVPDGRILFPMAQEPQPSIFNLWEIKVDEATGQPVSQPRRLTGFSGFGFVNTAAFSITADGKQLAVLRTTAQADVYVADFEPGGRSMKNPQRLTLDESDDSVWDWTADSQSVLFESNRNGNPDLFKQKISQSEPEPILVTSQYERHPNLTPDRAFILYLASDKRDAPATRLMRIPAGGGPPEAVLTGQKITNFSCAREANLCVVAEETEGKQILTKFDPMKGRGEKLSLPDYPGFRNGILSPQGRLIDRMKSRSDGLSIRVQSLTGAPPQEITFKKLIGDYEFLGWAPDEKGIYLGKWTSSEFTALYAGLNGRSQLFWKLGTSPGHSMAGTPIFSPDGRHLAFTVITYEANAWLVENF